MARKLAVTDGRPLIPEELITGQPYWKELSREDQQVVMEQTQKVGQLRFRMQASNLELGEILIVLRDKLKEHFRQHVEKLNIKERKAYRIIEYCKEVKKHVPVEALPTLMAMNLDLAHKKYIPYMRKREKPSREPSEVIEYAMAVISDQKMKMKTAKIEGEVMPPSPQDSEALLREAFRQVRSRFKKLPHNSKTRTRWVEHLVGYVLAELGVSGSHTFEAEAPPADIARGRGRPALS